MEFCVLQAYLHDEMGFSALFDGLHFSCDLGSRKPFVEFFRDVHEHLGVPQSQVFLLGRRAEECADRVAIRLERIPV